MSIHRTGTVRPAAVFILAAVAVGLLGLVSSCTIIQPGQVGVATLFGSVDDHVITEGAHAINPFSNVTKFDTKQQSYKEEKVTLTSQDQLVTTCDVSVQWHMIGSMAPQVLRETGLEERLVEVHLEPKIRSLMREIGKSVPRAEDFFANEMQQRLEVEIRDQLATYMQPKGVEIQAILLRDMQLPQVIQNAVQQKKQREQLAIQQQAELDRFTVEQQQKIATAEAERKAAELDSAKVRVLADARAYEIEALNKAMAANPAYVQLQALKTLEAISKDPAAKLYFLDGSSRSPLPLMHIGELDAPKK